MHRLLTSWCALCVAVSFGCRSQTSRSSTALLGSNGATTEASRSRTSHVGTWRSVRNEQHKLTDELISTGVDHADRSVLIYDGVGHWANSNMPLSTQRSKANDALTPDDAKEILVGRKLPNRSSSAAIGTYVFNIGDQFVFNHVLGYINPQAPVTGQGDTGTDRLRWLRFPPSQMIWKMLPLTRSDQITWEVWDRVPPLDQLTPTHRRLIGFWKVLSEERRKANGDTLSSTPVEAGYIVYTSSGYMQFHLVQPNRAKWAAAEPTPAEAKRTLETYTSYVAPYSIDEATRVVTHQGVGALSGQSGPDAHHTYEVSGNRLVLTSVPTMVAGQEVRTVVIGERVSGDDPALQP